MTARGPEASSGRPEVGYVARYVPSYRMAIMQKAAERLGHGLIVASGTPPGGSSMSTLMGPASTASNASRSASPSTLASSSGVSHLPLTNLWLRGETLHWQAFGPLFQSEGPTKVLLIEESPRTLSLRRLLRRARRQGLKTILWGHFSAIDRPLGGADWRDRQRLTTAAMADALLTYTDPLRDELAALLPEKPVFAARNTLDTDVLFPLGDALIEEGRSALRARLGLPDVPTLLFLGRMIAEKGPARVVDVARALAQDRGSMVSVVMIGDGPERGAVEALAAPDEVHLTCTGALSDLDASAPWIAACDVLVNPGYLGLSVNHAFALGVPVVAPAPAGGGVGHSPEWTYVRDQENGRFAQTGAVSDLVAATRDVLNDSQAYQRRAARFAREELAVDRMIDGMMQAIRHVDPSVGIRAREEG